VGHEPLVTYFIDSGDTGHVPTAVT